MLIRRIATYLSLIILAGMVLTVAALLPAFGAPPSHMDDYIIRNAQEEAGANNVVAAVLFDYRGLDTLGEATVLLAAATAVVMLLHTRTNGDEARE